MKCYFYLVFLSMIPLNAYSGEAIEKCNEKYIKPTTGMVEFIEKNIPKGFFFKKGADYSRIGMTKEGCVYNTNYGEKCIPNKFFYKKGGSGDGFSGNIYSNVDGLFFEANYKSPYWMFIGKVLDEIYLEGDVISAVYKQLGVNSRTVYFKYNGVNAKLHFSVQNYQKDPDKRFYRGNVDTTVVTYEIEKDENEFNRCLMKERERIRFEKANKKGESLIID